MKQISIWAKHHKWPARFTIIGLYMLLNYLGYQTGTLLNEMSVSISPTAFTATIIFFISAVAFYPAKTLRAKLSASQFYFRQKMCDFILVACTFCMIIYLTNHEKFPLNVSSAHAAIVAFPELPKDSAVAKYKSIAAFAASMKDESGNTLKWKERKKLLKTQIKAIKKSDELSKAAKTGLIILSVIVALGLLFLVAALACGLSCDGAEGAAILVGVGGTALVIFLLVLVIRSINNKGKKKESAQPKPAVQ